MKRKVNDFLEEYTDNFSELLVKTFLIRYLNEFDRDELPKQIKLLKNKLNKKIDSQFKKTVIDLEIKD